MTFLFIINNFWTHCYMISYLAFFLGEVLPESFINLNNSSKNYVLLNPIQHKKKFMKPVFWCIITIFICFRCHWNTIIIKQVQTKLYPFSYGNLVIFKNRICQNSKRFSTFKTVISLNTITCIAFLLKIFGMTIFTLFYFKCVQQIWFSAIF